MTHVLVLHTTLQCRVNELRKMPQYEKNLKDNKNREPQRDQDCRKVYPNVSHGGYSYILLWFCSYSWAFPRDSILSTLRRDPKMSSVPY